MPPVGERSSGLLLLLLEKTDQPTRGRRFKAVCVFQLFKPGRVIELVVRCFHELGDLLRKMSVTVENLAFPKGSFGRPGPGRAREDLIVGDPAAPPGLR